MILKGGYINGKKLLRTYLGNTLVSEYGIDTLKAFNFKPGFAVKSSFIASNRQPQMGIVAMQAERITDESDFKFHSIQRIQGVYDFSDSDITANYARANGLRVHGHTFCWVQGPQPSWLAQYANNPTALLVILENHIKAVVQRYDDIVDSWDAVNEPLTDGGGYKTGTWYTAFGPQYIHHAVRLVRKYAKPSAKIFINEYTQEYNGVKVTSLLRISDELAAAGNPIDGIGYQMHTSPNIDLTKYRDSLRRFVAKGLMIHISELDVKSWIGQSLPWPDYYTPEVEAKIAQLWKDIYRITITEVPPSKLWGITTWSVTDAENFENQKREDNPIGFRGNIVLFNTGGKPNANYNAVMSLINT